MSWILSSYYGNIVEESPDDYKKFARKFYSFRANVITQQIFLQSQGVSFDYTDKMNPMDLRELFDLMVEYLEEKRKAEEQAANM